MANPPRDRFEQIEHFIIRIFVILSVLIAAAGLLFAEIKSLFSLF